MNHWWAFLTGQALHLLVFRRGEWDKRSRDLIIASFALTIASTVALHGASSSSSSSLRNSWWASFRTSATLELAALAGLFTSLLVYRAFFHPLGKFPGPFAARLSNLHLIQLSRRFQLFKEVQQLHEQYGDVVRIGPSAVSVAKLEAVQLLHGPKSKCLKGPWYLQGKPLDSLHSTRDVAGHARQRLTWERGLNTAALRDYAPVVAETTQALLERIKASEGKVFDANKWFNLFSFEMMGWMAFGQSFDLIATGKKTYYMELIQKSVENVGTYANLPWLMVLMKQTPILSATFQTFRKWLRKQLISQMEKGPGQRTLFSSILEDFPSFEQLTLEQRNILEGDLFLIVVAGSDTVAVTLLDLFYELSLNPHVQKKLQEEIDAYFAVNEKAEPALLSKLEYLQACVNETLRLWPPVTSGTQRMTPPEGLQVGDAFIPGNMLVQIPTYTVHRDEEAFAQANEFIPERWTTKPELIKDRSVFHPFSIGKYSCVGKQLALVELRQVTAEVLKRFDVELAPGFTSKDFTDNLKDHFTLEAARLDLSFKAR